MFEHDFTYCADNIRSVFLIKGPLLTEPGQMLPHWRYVEMY